MEVNWTITWIHFWKMNTATLKKRGSYYGQKNNKLGTNQSGKSSKHVTKKSTSHKGNAWFDSL